MLSAIGYVVVFDIRRWEMFEIRAFTLVLIVYSREDSWFAYGSFS